MIQIIQEPIRDKDLESTYLDRYEKGCDLILRDLLMNYPMDYRGISAVEIETVNRCNNDCPFCPVNRNADTREYHKMTEALFYKIINELAEIEYRGEVSLFSNNEPLLDHRIFDFLAVAKSKLPYAHHSLYTNGMLLDKEKFEKLILSLDTLYIDNYSDDSVIMNNVQEIIDFYENKVIPCEVFVLMRKKHQILDSRGGAAPNRQGSLKVYTSTCIAPYMQLIIRPDGKISRCCQDALGNTTMGDVSESTLQSIWSSRNYISLRQRLNSGERKKLSQCKFCDVFGNAVYVPKNWLSKLVAQLVDICMIQQNCYKKKIYVYGNEVVSRKIGSILDLSNVNLQANIYSVDELKKVNVDESFVVFPFIDCEILDSFDPEISLLGKNYITCDIISELLRKPVSPYQSQKMYRNMNGLGKLMSRRFYVFGTGSFAKRFMETMGEVFNTCVLGFLDNNQEKWDCEEFIGKKIYSPQILREDSDNIVVITSSYYKEIAKQLIDEKLCKEENIYDASDLLNAFL